MGLSTAATSLIERIFNAHRAALQTRPTLQMRGQTAHLTCGRREVGWIGAAGGVGAGAVASKASLFSGTRLGGFLWKHLLMHFTGATVLFFLKHLGSFIENNNVQKHPSLILN